MTAAAPLRAVGVRPSIRMFGPLTVTIGGRPLSARELGGAKPRNVLGVLLCARGRPVAKERLCELLWGEEPPRNPAAALENYVFVLRRALSADGIPPLVVTEPRAYRFATDAVDVDLDRFDALVLQAAGTEPRPRALLEEALALASRELLEDDRYASWAQDLRASYAGVVDELRLDAAEAALRDRDLRTALAHAEGAIAADAFNERAYRTAMLALYGLGRQHHALETFNRCRSVLTQELGIEPLHETKVLHAQILRQADAEQVLASATAPPSALEASPSPAAVAPPRPTLPQIVGTAGGPSVVLARVAAGAGGATALEAAVREGLGATDGRTGIAPLLDLMAGRAPLVLVLDGLDASDRDAVHALEELERGCRGTGITIVARYRSDDPLGEDPLQALKPAASAQVGQSRLVVAGDPLRSAFQSAAVSLSLVLPVLSWLADVLTDFA